jgi:hypothetical protein
MSQLPEWFDSEFQPPPAFSKADLPGPSIASAAKVWGGIDVTISVPAGQALIKPAAPDVFGVFDAGESLIPISGKGGGPATCCASPATRMPRPGCAYPINLYRQPYVDNIIRLDNPSPLFAGDPGLVLESCKTITLA